MKESGQQVVVLYEDAEEQVSSTIIVGYMWRKERQGKSEEVGSHARASLYYMVEHWERHLHGGGQESGDSRQS